MFCSRKADKVKKIYHKKNSEYNRIIQNYKPYRYKYISLYIERTNNDNYMFGFSVGRNWEMRLPVTKIKRQLKAIISKKLSKRCKLYYNG